MAAVWSVDASPVARSPVSAAARVIRQAAAPDRVEPRAAKAHLDSRPGERLAKLRRQRAPAIAARRVRLQRAVHIEEPEPVRFIEHEADRATGGGGFGMPVLVRRVDRLAIQPRPHVRRPLDRLSRAIGIGNRFPRHPTAIGGKRLEGVGQDHRLQTRQPPDIWRSRAIRFKLTVGMRPASKAAARSISAVGQLSRPGVRYVPPFSTSSARSPT